MKPKSKILQPSQEQEGNRKLPMESSNCLKGDFFSVWRDFFILSVAPPGQEIKENLPIRTQTGENKLKAEFQEWFSCVDQ